MDVKCTNKDCLHKWVYRGKLGNNDYITCPKCRYKSLLRKAKLSEKSTDLLTDLPTHSPYSKEIKQSQTEKVEKRYYDGVEKDMVRVDIGDGMTALVEKKIAQQIKNAPNT